MIQLYAVVEGATEEEFIKRVLAPHLEQFSVYATPIVVATRRERNGLKLKGGGDWRKWHADIRRIKFRADAHVTTLFDLYGLPKGFPGLELHATEPNSSRRADLLEQELGRRSRTGAFSPTCSATSSRRSCSRRSHRWKRCLKVSTTAPELRGSAGLSATRRRRT